MLSQRLIRARPLSRLIQTPLPLPRLTQTRCLTQADIDDPKMNGGYVQPPSVKREFRDPHADWWDKQERRNYGEPVHEDNDILCMFSPEESKQASPFKAIFQLGCFIVTIFSVCGVVSHFYADKPSVPRKFPGGLDKELGGPGALLAPSEDDP